MKIFIVSFAGGIFLMDLSQLLNDVNDFVWGPIMLAFLVGTGIFLTIRLKFLPFGTQSK